MVISPEPLERLLPNSILWQMQSSAMCDQAKFDVIKPEMVQNWRQKLKSDRYGRPNGSTDFHEMGCYDKWLSGKRHRHIKIKIGQSEVVQIDQKQNMKNGDISWTTWTIATKFGIMTNATQCNVWPSQIWCHKTGSGTKLAQKIEVIKKCWYLLNRLTYCYQIWFYDKYHPVECVTKPSLMS